MKDPEINIDIAKRKELEKILGANNLSHCYQCGACVGDCPTARFNAEFNPRKIMLLSLMGSIDELLTDDSKIWICSNCYNCYERCPQDVRPVEVIIALKNLAIKKGLPQEEIRSVTERIIETGRSVPVLSSTDRARLKLGLKELNKIDSSDLIKLFRQEKGDS